MPCKTAEERQVRDRKVFLLHNLFVDVATFRAIKAVQKVMADPVLADDSQVLFSETVGDLSVTVTRDTSNASSKVDTKIDGIQATGLDKMKLMERNLLKGLTADENTAAHVSLFLYNFQRLRFVTHCLTFVYGRRMLLL